MITLRYPTEPMKTFYLVWRPIAGGDIFEQSWQGPTRAAALRRWRRFWGLTIRSCAEFKMEEV